MDKNNTKFNIVESMHMRRCISYHIAQCSKNKHITPRRKHFLIPISIECIHFLYVFTSSTVFKVKTNLLKLEGTPKLS